jgi:O-antigen/teichoic acid export membrane protein
VIKETNHATSAKAISLRGLLKGSVTLLLLNLIAGALTYFYQLRAAQSLSLEAYGRLNSLFALYAVGMIIGIYFQMRAVISNRNQTVVVLGRILSFVGLGFAIAGRTHPDLLTTSFLFQLLGLLVPGIGLQILMGFLQSAEQWVLLGTGSALLACGKLLGSWGATDWMGYYSAVQGSLTAVGCLGTLVYAVRQPLQQVEARSSKNQDWLSAFLMSVGWTWIPSYDLLNLRILLPPAAAGQWSQLQLFGKILYYLPQAFLQVTLPRYSKLYLTPSAREEWSALARLELVGLGATYVCALAMSLGGPWVALHFLHLNLSGHDLWRVCFGVVPLYGVLAAIQVLGAFRETRKMIFLLALTLCTTAIACFAQGAVDFSGYLWISLVWNTVLGAASLWLLKMHKRGSHP